MRTIAVRNSGDRARFGASSPSIDVSGSMASGTRIATTCPGSELPKLVVWMVWQVEQATVRWLGSGWFRWLAWHAVQMARCCVPTG